MTKVNKEIIDKCIGTLFDNTDSLIVIGKRKGDPFCFMAGSMEELVELVEDITEQLGE